ncbi:hypothetical protein GGI07_000743 [Coemansia sp. Benny D115]|nr:hypothetical protein GGI07_000743 [Coemansia sp. Benny D115]
MSGHDASSSSNLQPVHLAIVADPQIIDHYSYGQSGVLLKVVEFFTDIYIRKSYRFLQTIRNPSHVIFLGDLMDGGREWADDAWQAEFTRFQSIFFNRQPNYMQVYYMAGNHDIGIGNTIVPGALRRFRLNVGPLNQVLELGGHQIILLDTLTLENDDPRVSNQSAQLVARLAADSNNLMPRLLFTHVPLWRPPKTFCGAERQSREKYLLDRRGYQFRDQLFQNTTHALLRDIRPDAVFSGDDHDSCTVQHPIPGSMSDRATEYTIGAFGWASGVPIASYALLTLYPPPSAVAGKDNSGGQSSAAGAEFMIQRCFLPYQLGIYKLYIGCFVLSLIVISLVCYQASHTWCDKITAVNVGDNVVDDNVVDDNVGRREGSEETEDDGDCNNVNKRLLQRNSPFLLPFAAGISELQAGGGGGSKTWSFSRKRFSMQFGMMLKDVVIVAVPTYIGCILFYYIF